MSQPVTAAPHAQSQQPLTPDRIMMMAWGYAPPLMMEAAIRHGVFDLLDNGPLPLADVAAKTGASERGLRAVMNGLVGVGLLAKAGERYSLTPESSTFLVSTKPNFAGAILKHVSTQLIPKWLELTEIVRTGRPGRAVNGPADGQAFFAEFVEDIFPMSYPAARALAEDLKLAERSTSVSVLDIAAGSGVWGIALAHASPRVNVTAVDWPGVLPTTRRVAQKHGVGERFRYVEGDILSADLGSGHHVATLGHILHSEGEARSRQLLRRVRDALAPGGTIAIAEFVAADDRTGPPNAVIFAVNMLVNTEQGDTFTFAEMSRWLTEAGFGNVRQLPAPGPSPLIVATRR
jgi:ubiquinone/menaquinone biosynthesis C-methylase UbiE